MLKITHSLICILFTVFSVFSANNFQLNGIENEILNITLYPNPTKEKVEITFSEPINTNICIHDNLGNVVFEIPTENKSKVQVALKGLSAGIYFVSVKTEQKTIIKRLIKY